MKKNTIIHVFGRVQGVGFRYFVRSTANAIGITGYVTNEANGSVYIEAEGTAEQLDNFIGMCRRGPGHADVRELRHFEGPLMNYTSFRIK